jgi:carboxyl-terminal processing protease
MPRRWVLLALLAAVSFGGGGAAARYAARRGHGNREREARLLQRAVEAIRRNYVDSLPADSLYLKATDGLVHSLNDPYAELMLADAYRRFNQQMSGTRIQLAPPAAPREGGAVSGWGLGFTEAGQAIGPGDEILAVDGRSTRGMSDADAAELIAADTSSIVTLLVRPRGETAAVIRRVARTAVHIPAVSPGVLLGHSTGYVALHIVTQASARELYDAVSDLRRRGMRSLVLDLRRNPGGLIAQGVSIAELFLDAGDTIAVMHGRGRSPVTAHVAQSDQPWPDMPLVLLVNRQTASSAEVIAAALQDHDRAVVVGAPTYGKGVIQTTFPLRDDVAVKFTTARWYAPSGRSIQRITDSAAAPAEESFRSATGRPLAGHRGIVPDVPVRPRWHAGADALYNRETRATPNSYRAALSVAAAAIVGQSHPASPRFSVTADMREALWASLVERGVPVRRWVFDAAEMTVNRDLGYAVARQRWGESAEIERRSGDDPAVRAALALTSRAATPGALVALAGNPLAGR